MRLPLPNCSASSRSAARCAAAILTAPAPMRGPPNTSGRSPSARPSHREGRLREIPGVGEALADIIIKLHKTGTHPSLEAMRQEFPAGVLEMLAVPGLRPETVATIHKKLGIASLAELDAAARADKLKDVKGLVASLQNKILQGLEVMRTGEGQRHLHGAAALLEGAATQLRRTHPDLKRITPAGEFRRGCELVSDLCLVVEARCVPGSSETISSGEPGPVPLARATGSTHRAPRRRCSPAP
jgi:DNA polymerase/3'-5' exonuclease PolX